MSLNTQKADTKAMSKELVGECQIFFAIVFFGASFVGQRYAMLHTKLGPLTFNACRFTVSSVFLVFSRPWLQALLHSELNCEDDTFIRTPQQAKEQLKSLWFWGGICGLSNFFGSILQQESLITVTAGKVGFITGMYVVVVPIVEWLIPGRQHNLTCHSWIAAIVSMIGMYFLSGCVEAAACFGGALGNGELLVFCSIFFWVISIMASDYGSKTLDCVDLTCVEFVICAVLCIALALVYEPSTWDVIFSCTWEIIVVGFTEAAAYLLGSLGQMYTPAPRAALLYSLESVSAAIGGYLFLQETMAWVELFGCALMFGATLISTIEWSSSDEEGVESSPLIGLNTCGHVGPVADRLRRRSASESSAHSHRDRSGSYNSYQGVAMTSTHSIEPSYEIISSSL